ncbi:MAG: glycosyltransferase [Desulfovibrionaceae bacterium]|nr:glycosyltransferase [Desulfovibrionaceae bacterium]MBF0515109.1 glycosyltransferase [Desulfovibrionaceae bacterium]
MAELSECSPIYDGDGRVVDAVLTAGGKRRHLFGRRALENETLLAGAVLAAGDVLPVFLGSGLGRAIAAVLDATSGPVAVLDKERAIALATGTRTRLERDYGDRVLWIDEARIDEVLAGLTRWQLQNGGKPLFAVLNPVYARLGGFYLAVRDRLEAARAVDLRQRAAYPRFAGQKPRVLCILKENNFIQPEIVSALVRLGAPVGAVTLTQTTPAREFIAALLREILAFKPDFVFTVNHYGVDEGGMLIDLLSCLGVPLASWLVDHPELAVSEVGYLASPGAMLFSCDAASIEGLTRRGHRAHYLPLASDPALFAPIAALPIDHPWRARVSFVGDAFRGAVAERLKSGRFPAALLRAVKPLAALALADPLAPVERLIETLPDASAAYRELRPRARRFAFAQTVALTASRILRERCLEKILEFAPLLAGPPALRVLARGAPGARLIGEIYYNTDLPAFYQCSQINFNATSVQMRGALNQRLFDVPACGAFLLTDYSEQIEPLFDLNSEIACYRDPEEIPDLIRFYLAHPRERERIAGAARRRVLAGHTYDHRMAELLAVMRRTYA